MIPDKRDECGCHRECTVYPHTCARPCIWPACLSEQEHAEVLAELRAVEERDLAELRRRGLIGS